MRARHTLSTLLLVLVMSAMAAASVPERAYAAIIDGVAARINTEIITLYDIRVATTPYLLQRGMDPQVLSQPGQRAKIYREVLGDLIESKLLLQEAGKLSITIADEEIEQWMAYTRQQQGLSQEEFRETIEEYGMSYADYRNMVRQNLVRMRITQVKVGAKVSVSDAEVEAKYRERYGSMGLNERYINVKHILVQPASEAPEALELAKQRALSLRTRIAQGESFDDVARKDSDGPSAKKGGKLGTFRRGELDADFEEAAFKLEVNQLSEVVRTKFGYHIIVVSQIEEKPNPDIADRKDEIRGVLSQKATERQLAIYIKGLRERAFIDVKI